MSKRVVITGIGPVTSTGIGKESFFANILKHEMCVKRIPADFETNYEFKSKYYTPLPEFSFADYELPAHYEKVMQDEDRIAALAAKLALEDAGFKIIKDGKTNKVDGLSECSVILGTGFSGLETAFHSYLVHIIKDEKIINDLIKKRIRFNRMIIPMMMPNSVSAWVSILFKLKGSCFTVNASCASGAYAVGESFKRIKDGYDKLVLAGGVECLKENTGAVMRGFDMLGALTKSADGAPVPFSKKRSGFLFSEGAGCILVLEELNHALKRKADIYAEIIDYQSNSDGFNIVQIENSGSQIIKLLKKLKGNRKIDYLNSHGTGTLPNDEIEAKAIKEVFGSKQSQPLINATKGILGHSIGASGALEAAVTALSIKKSIIHGNQIPDPIEGVNLVSQTIEKPVTYAVSTSYGFGGHNGGILFKRYNLNF